jgi:general secretion pathway protein I
MRASPASRDGLSLLEVLVSMAIFLMALVALTYLVNTATERAGEAQYRARAAQLCHSKLNELMSGALPLESQPDSSIEDEPNFRWSAEIEPAGAQGLYNVLVRVRYRPDDPYPIEVALSRMMLDPKVCGSSQDVPAAPAESASESESGAESSTPSSGSGNTGANTTQPSSGSKGGSTTQPSSGSKGGSSGPTTPAPATKTPSPASGGKGGGATGGTGNATGGSKGR